MLFALGVANSINFSDCVIRCGSVEESLKCTHIEYPNHPHHSRRQKCNTLLLKKVHVGKIMKLVPRKVFMYQNVVQCLMRFTSRPGFITRCNLWRERNSNIEQDIISYIYDGRVWKSLHCINEEPFLSELNNWCLALNVDWFNPYKQTPYSVGAMYLSILNLPRAERFKVHNMILVGLIPGPNEPSDMNPFLSPLVEDLKRLFEGIYVTDPVHRPLV